MRVTMLALLSLLFVDFAFADNYVRPHVRRDGTYVEGHMRSSPNSNRFDNYSSQGNVNPYTGQRGSDRNEFSNPPEYNTGRRDTNIYQPQQPQPQQQRRRNSPF